MRPLYFILLCSILLCISCNRNRSNNSSSITTADSVRLCMEQHAVPVLREKPTIHTASQRIADLNQDGVLDTIHCIFYCSSSNLISDSLLLSVNNIKLFQIGSTNEPYYIIDIDTTDHFGEIAFEYYSGDTGYYVSIYRFNDESVYLLSSVRGILFENPTDGNAELYIKRDCILPIGFLHLRYRLVNNQLIYIQESFYHLNWDLSVKQTLALFKHPNNKDTVIVLKPSDKITIIGQDSTLWFLARTDRKVEGWFAIDEHRNVIGTGLYIREVFDGLGYEE